MGLVIVVALLVMHTFSFPCKSTPIIWRPIGGNWHLKLAIVPIAQPRQPADLLPDFISTFGVRFGGSGMVSRWLKQLASRDAIL